MQRISSGMTFFYKRVFPFIWFGFLTLIIAIPLTQSWLRGSPTAPPVPVLIGPALMIVIGYFLMKRLVFDLVDEVLDVGDALIIRNGGQEEHIALADITNINYSPFVNPPRITLSLRNPGRFGDRVTFCAPVRFVPLSSSPLIDELIRRVDAARQHSLARRRTS